MTKEEKRFVALTQACRDLETKDPKTAKAIHRLYQYMARQAFDDGSITTGPHLLFEKCLTNVRQPGIEQHQTCLTEKHQRLASETSGRRRDLSHTAGGGGSVCLVGVLRVLRV
eukprot:1192330-Prorocentrum_minimum.AAC.4